MKLANLDFHLWDDWEELPTNDDDAVDRGSWGDGGVDGLI